jgi:TetR/AcrR family tetracycline transcriptional repressor
MAETKRPALSRQTLIAAALRLLDDVGLEGLTMRRLATVLGVQSPALYWHIRTKQELLDGMAEVIILDAGMGPPRDGEPWQDWLLRRARAYRASVRSHRDGALVVASVSHLYLSTLTTFEQELRAMTDRGFSPALALRTITTLSQYTTGFLMQEQARRSDAGSAPERAAALVTLLGEDSAILAAVRSGATIIGDDAFEHGIRLIIEGTERLIHKPQRRRTAR